MASSKKGGIRKPPAKSSASEKGIVLIALSAAGEVFARLVDRFGWPGLFLILGYLFVERHGTEQQKQEIIERFILGKDIAQWYPLGILGVLFLIVAGAQTYVFRKRERILQEEISRLGAWKSAHQEASIEVNLHHTEVLTEKG